VEKEADLGARRIELREWNWNTRTVARCEGYID
jgi:hypothetical protein